MSISVADSFEQGQQLFLEFEKTDLPSSSDDYQKLVTRAIRSLSDTAELTEKLHLFSVNEELDDIQTNHLRLLLVDYYLGILTSKCVDPAFHLQNAKQAKAYLDSFFQRCEHYKLLSKEDKTALHREGATDAATTRAEKIARAKREREINSLLQAKLKHQAELRQRADKGHVGAAAQDEGSIDELLDEEEERQLALLVLQGATVKALQEYGLLKQEIDMLETVEKMKAQSGGRLKMAPPEQPRAPPPKPVTITREMIAQTKRLQLQDQVFQPGHILPTMSVEQWAEEQMRLGNLPSPGQVNQEAPKPKDESEMDDVEQEADRRKKSSWDDWKDDNPKGAGNKNDSYFKR